MVMRVWPSGPGCTASASMLSMSPPVVCSSTSPSSTAPGFTSAAGMRTSRMAKLNSEMPRSSTSRSPLGRKAQSVGLVPSPDDIAQRPLVGLAQQVGRVLAVVVEDALGQQQGRAGDRRGRRGDADRFERFVGARVAQPFGDGDLAGRALRHGRRPAAKSATRVRFSKPTRTALGTPSRSTTASDFGVAGIGAGQVVALGVLEGLDA